MARPKAALGTGRGAPTQGNRNVKAATKKPRNVAEELSSASEADQQHIWEDLKQSLRGEVPPRPAYVSKQLIVKVRADTVRAPAGAAGVGARSTLVAETVDRPFRFLEDRGLIEETVPVFAAPDPAGYAHHGSRAARALSSSVAGVDRATLRGINLVRVTRERDLLAVLRTLESTPGVEYVERVPARWPLAPPKRRPPARRASPATVSAELWHLREIGWYDLPSGPDASKVKVAVLDTGLDTTHPALAGAWGGYVHTGASAEDIVGHGTHVAGIINARFQQQNSMRGVCACDLHAWKIFPDQPDADGDYYVDELMYQRALIAALDAGARVINLSIGGTASSQTEEALLKQVRDGGVTVVAAMGNEYEEGNPTEYPAAYDGVVAVGAVGRNLRRASFSNTGAHIALCAPGVSILSTLPLKPSAARAETEYAEWDGTSMATPQVSAAVALLLARRPDWSPAKVVARLKSSARRLPSMSEGHSRAYGAGLLDLGKLLK